VVVGAAVGIAVGLPATWQYGVQTGWMAAATTYLLWVWLTIGRMDAAATAAHAVHEDPGKAATDVFVVSAALASLISVGLLLTQGSSHGGRVLHAGVSVAGIFLAWGAVHTIFTTRYARLYYSDSPGGIDFNSDDPPTYADFAYLAIAIGMTYQVSDTALKSRAMRLTVLRHGLLSFLFGTVIIASTINLIAGLAK
jgi:uncharacterized membrane protein